MFSTCCRLLRCFNLYKPIILTIFLVSFLILPNLLPVWASTNQGDRPRITDFPVYPAIKPNVEFWIDIFTRYSAGQGVFHDSNRTDIVYEVIRVDSSGTVRARRKNKRAKNAVVKKYKNILLHLSTGALPVSKEQKRVAGMFGEKVRLSDFKRSASNIRCQTGLKEEFKAGLERSGAVIEAFKKTFQAQGLPVDLVYLPCVESSYNFRAYSKFGAAGIWQFTRSTGQQYMRINYVVDERRDPYISTVAAARLLKKNYRELKNWPMAITAYNHGLAGMKRAKKSKGSYENIFKSFHSRSFKFASRNFYSEFLAAKKVAKNPNKYFSEISYHKPISFSSIRIKGFLPIQDASDVLNISTRELKRLNPSLRPPVFNGHKYIPKGFNLRLPSTFSSARAGKSLTAVYHKKQKPSRFHRVQKGDTAGSIARLHSVKLSDLLVANQLNRRATIYIGQNLTIPVKNDIILANKTPKTIKSYKKIQMDPKKQSPIKIIASAPVEKNIPKVQKKPETILPTPKAKPLENDRLVNPNIVVGNLKILQTYQKKDVTIGVVKVEAEETLGHYADWLQIPTQEIRTLNRIKYGSPISMEQKIKLPLRKKSIQEFEEQRYEFHKEIEEDFFESFSIQAMEVYKVRNGDSIWSLCLNELEIPFWLVKKYNPNINFNALHPKQKIHYPILSTNKENEPAGAAFN